MVLRRRGPIPANADTAWCAGGQCNNLTIESGRGTVGVKAAGRTNEGYRAATGSASHGGERMDGRGRHRAGGEPDRIQGGTDGHDAMGWRIGVDIGGTFTDVAVLDEASGRAGIAKVSTTPHDFGAAVIEGARAAIDEYGIVPEAVTLLSHATTVVTNALLEAKGANVALVATRGFRDVLEIRRSARADLYDLFQDAPAVLVPRRRRLEVTERIDAQGEIVTTLDEAEIDALIDSVRGFGGVQAVAVCLMFSFLNDVHERRIGERLRAALPGIRVFLSSEILPEIREFERTSTTAVCAYVGPVLASYLERLAAALAEELDIPEVVIPPIPGGFSALGLVATDLRRDWSHTFYSPIESIDPAVLDRRLAELERSAGAMLRDAGIAHADRVIERAADCRYAKQAYELTVPLAGGTVTRESLDALAREFHSQHRRTYGHENPNESVQMVNVRVTATGRMPPVEFRAAAAQAGGGTTGKNGAASGGGTITGGRVEAEREVWFGEPILCPVIGRHDLASGLSRGGRVATARPGPYIVEEMDCTVVVPPGWSAGLDERGCILMARRGRGGSDRG